MKLLLDENLAAATRVASIEAINTTHRRAGCALCGARVVAPQERGNPPSLHRKTLLSKDQNKRSHHHFW